MRHLSSAFLLAASLACAEGISAQGYCGFADEAAHLPPIDFDFDGYRVLRERSAKTPSRTGDLLLSDVPVSLHVIHRADGTGASSLPEATALLAAASAAFAEGGIRFTVYESNVIRNTAYYDDLTDADLRNGDRALYNPSTLNVYFTGALFSNAGGIANLPGDGLNVAGIGHFVSETNSAEGVLIHELGHAMGLLHTFGGGDEIAGGELVDGSNCRVRGDGICDTPADPNRWLNPDPDDLCNLVVDPSFRDANGERFDPDPRFYMSYANPNCTSRFSQGQFALMNHHLHNSASRRDLSYDGLSATFTVDGRTTPFEVCSRDSEVVLRAPDGMDDYEWDFGADGSIDARGAVAQFVPTSQGANLVRLTTRKDGRSMSRVRAALTVGGRDTPVEEGFAELFQELPEGWTQVEGPGGLDWEARPYRTLVTASGPDAGRGGSGSYVYLRAYRGDAVGEEAILEMPCASTRAGDRLSFYYHMYGSDIGALHVDLRDADGTLHEDITPPLIGQQHASGDAAFALRDVGLDDYAGQTVTIRFRGVRGAGNAGDIALDDIAIRGAGPLPVDFVSVAGSAFDTYNRVAWRVAAEEGVERYVLERATEAGAFEEIGRVPAAGEPNARDYHLDDRTPRPSAYYRVVGVDADGTTTESEVVVVRRPISGPPVRLVPNPANAHVTVEGAEGATGVHIVDALGRVVLAGDLRSATLPIAGLSPGLYTVTVNFEAGAPVSRRLLVR